MILQYAGRALAILCIVLMSGVVHAQNEKQEEKPDFSTPEAAARSFFAALEKGDADRAKAAAVPEERQQEAVAALTKFVSSMKKVEEAAIEQFGEEEGKQILEQPDGQGLQVRVERNLEDARVEVDGDTATIHTEEEGDKPIMLRRIDGDWRVDLAAGEQEQDLRQAVPMFESIASAADDIATEIGEGKFASVQEAEQALGTRIFTAMMSAAARQGPEEGQPAPAEETDD